MSSPAEIHFVKNSDGTFTVRDSKNRLRRAQSHTPFGPDEAADICFELCHENYLNLNFVQLPDLRYHQWFTDSGRQKFYPSLVDYVNYLKSQDINPISIYSSKSGTGPSYFYIPQEYIRLFRGMVRFLRYIHSLGHSLHEKSLLENSEGEKKLDAEEHFAVVEGVLKFWNIDLQKADKESRAHDFKLIADVMRFVLDDEDEKRAPYDFKEFLLTMDNYYEWECHIKQIIGDEIYGSGDLIERHIAILTHSERNNFMVDCIHKGECLSQSWKMYYHKAILGLQVQQGWCSRFHSSFEPVPFELVLRSVVSKPSRENPQARHQPPPFGTDKAIEFLSIEYKDERGSSDYDIKRGLLQCCRDLATHVVDSARHVLRWNERLEDKDIDLMISHVFIKELVQFQVCLFNEQILDRFVE